VIQINAFFGKYSIGMVFVGVHKGYRVTIVMPEDMSEERKKTIKVFGGELILIPANNCGRTLKQCCPFRS